MDLLRVIVTCLFNLYRYNLNTDLRDNLVFRLIRQILIINDQTLNFIVPNLALMIDNESIYKIKNSKYGLVHSVDHFLNLMMEFGHKQYQSDTGLGSNLFSPETKTSQFSDLDSESTGGKNSSLAIFMATKLETDMFDLSNSHTIDFSNLVLKFTARTNKLKNILVSIDYLMLVVKLGFPPKLTQRGKESSDKCSLAVQLCKKVIKLIATFDKFSI